MILLLLAAQPWQPQPPPPFLRRSAVYSSCIGRRGLLPAAGAACELGTVAPASAAVELVSGTWSFRIVDPANCTCGPFVAIPDTSGLSAHIGIGIAAPCGVCGVAARRRDGPHSYDLFAALHASQSERLPASGRRPC